MMYSELENFSKELKWYSAGVYNKEFLFDISMVTRMESTRTAQNLRVPHAFQWQILAKIDLGLHVMSSFSKIQN